MKKFPDLWKLKFKNFDFKILVKIFFMIASYSKAPINLRQISANKYT